MSSLRLLVHIVTWSSEDSIAACMQSVVQQQGFVLGESLVLRVTDNCSGDSTVDRARQYERPGVEICVNEANLGFCGAHNQGVRRLLEGGFDALVVLNPDVRLESDALQRMIDVVKSARDIGMVTPKLLRANADLSPVEPPVLDAAGMVLTASLRHFDRGSGEVDVGRFDQPEDVFGGTGACLLVTRHCAEHLLISPAISDEPVTRIYPQLAAGVSDRPKLFDEAFFAYREDADISWRAQLLGWRCRYEPRAVGYHVRVVVPERRAQLPAALNRYSVRNRFLLQIHNWRISQGVWSLINGILFRNVVVICGVLLREHSSFGALVEVVRLLPRALEIRKDISRKMPGPGRSARAT
jgi:GT2 family glycosyltransferase